MSTKYKFTDKAATYFTISTIVDWIGSVSHYQVFIKERNIKRLQETKIVSCNFYGRKYGFLMDQRWAYITV